MIAQATQSTDQAQSSSPSSLLELTPTLNATFMYKLLTYYSMIYRIFKLEYFTSKANSNKLDILELERYVHNGSDYWKMMESKDQEITEEELQFEIYSDSEDSEIDKNVVSKAIIKQIVRARRRRSKLQDDLENLYESMNNFMQLLNALSEKTLDSILEFTIIYHENRYSNAVYSIDRVLEKIYETKTTKMNEDIFIKQIHSLQSLSKKLSNRDQRYIPWFNYRYYGNYKEYYIRAKSSINENATSPKEIDILHKLYPPIKFSKNVFSGQKIEQPYSCLDTEILDLTKETRALIHSASNTSKGIINDYLEIFKLSNKKGVDNIRERNEMLKTLILRSQLKYALYSWYSCSDYPVSPNQYSFLLAKFKDDLFKKCYEQKNSFLKSIEQVVGSTKLDTSSNDFDIVLTPLEKEKLKIARIKEMSRFTLVELVSTAKAEAIVIRDEIDRFLMIHAIDIVEQEYAAINTAIDSDVSQISALIHPYQQFTSV